METEQCLKEDHNTIRNVPANYSAIDMSILKHHLSEFYHVNLID